MKLVTASEYSDYIIGPILRLPTDDLGNHVFSACKRWVKPTAVREPLSCTQLPPAHPQLQWSKAHIPVFLTEVVCFDSQGCLPLHILGANWAQIPLK